MESKEEGRFLRVLLWNVWLLPWTPHAKLRARLIREYIMSITTQADVIVLNEVFSNAKVLYSKELLAKYPYQARLGRENCATIFKSGVWILSQFPIEQTWKMAFKDRSGWDKFAAKGVLGVRIEIGPGKKADVYGTHMQAGYSGNAQSARLCQVDQILSFVRLHSNSASIPIVFCGDLNMGPPHPTLTRRSVHYKHERDEKARIKAYLRLSEGLQSSEAIYKTNSFDVDAKEDDINRFLLCYEQKGTVEYLQVPNGNKGNKSFQLSDTACLMFTVRIY